MFSRFPSRNTYLSTLGFVNDPQWASVAITRAKRGFVVVCDVDMFSEVGGVWGDLLQKYKEQQSSP